MQPTAYIFCLIVATSLVSAVHNKLIHHCSGKAANIMFLMDSSSSIWVVDYRRQLEFVENLVDTFDIGPSKSQVRVGAITFSDQAHIEFSLDRYSNRTALKKAIGEIPYRTGMTNTAAALHLLRLELKPRLQTSNAPFVAVVITDGLSRDPAATRKEARKLHRIGVHVYAIGVGYHYSLDELKAIASDKINNLHQVSSYSALKGIVRNFNIKTCKDITTISPPRSSSSITTTQTTKATTQTTTELTRPPTTTTRRPTTTTTTPAPTTTTTSTTTTTPVPTTTTTIPITTSTTTTTTTTTRLTERITPPRWWVRRRYPTPPPPPPPTTPKRVRQWPYRNTYLPKPGVDQSDLAQRDAGSTITFGYDLLSMGAYRAHRIAQFINTLLPHTGYQNYGVVSYPYCPEKYNIPVTSLMNNTESAINLPRVSPGRLPGVADVVRRMRRDLYGQAVQNYRRGIRGRQSAVLFVDPAITRITPRVIHEARRLKQQGSKLFLVNVGQKKWPHPRTIRSLSSQPHQNYMFNAPTYDDLLSRAKRSPFQFRSMCNKYVTG